MSIQLGGKWERIKLAIGPRYEQCQPATDNNKVDLVSMREHIDARELKGGVTLTMVLDLVKVEITVDYL